MRQPSTRKPREDSSGGPSHEHLGIWPGWNSSLKRLTWLTFLWFVRSFKYPNMDACWFCCDWRLNIPMSTSPTADLWQILKPAPFEQENCTVFDRFCCFLCSMLGRSFKAQLRAKNFSCSAPSDYSLLVSSRQPSEATNPHSCGLVLWSSWRPR